MFGLIHFRVALSKYQIGVRELNLRVIFWCHKLVIYPYWEVHNTTVFLYCVNRNKTQSHSIRVRKLIAWMHLLCFRGRSVLMLARFMRSWSHSFPTAASTGDYMWNTRLLYIFTILSILLPLFCCILMSLFYFTRMAETAGFKICKCSMLSLSFSCLNHRTTAQSLGFDWGRGVGLG